LVETVGTEQSDGIAAAAAAVVGQSIKTAEAMTRLNYSAGRLISRLYIWLCIGLYRTWLSIKALSVALYQALHRQALRPHSSISNCASDCASGSISSCASSYALVALHCIFCVYVYVHVYMYACMPALTAGRRLSN